MMIKELATRPARPILQSIETQLQCRFATSRLSQRPKSWPVQQHRGMSSKVEDWTGLVRPMASWITNDASRFNTHEFLNQLPCVDAATTPKIYRSVLFLVTPQLSHLFQQDSNLHAAAINRIFPTTACSGERESIVAVVDAIPALGPIASRRAEKPESHGYEGVAVCVSDHFGKISTETRKQDDSRPAIVILKRARKFPTRSLHQLKFAVAPANTLFVNGQPHTMYALRWEAFEQGYVPVRGSYDSLRWIEMSAYSSSRGSQLRPGVMRAGLQPLTEPAYIESSMGNVIREIRLANGSIVSASHELETLVPAKLKECQTKLSTGEIRVYAFCSAKPLITWGHAGSQWTVRTSPEHRFEQSYFTFMLFNHARLHRVNGGGAGWGKKAGLLSLDPETKIYGNSANDPGSAIDLDKVRNISDLSQAGELFRHGESVQFMYSFHDPEGAKKQGYKIQDCAASDFYREDYFLPTRNQEIRIGGSFQADTTQITQENKGNSAAEFLQKFNPMAFGFLGASRLSVWTRLHAQRQVNDVPRRGAERFQNLEELVDQSSLSSTLIDVPNCCVSLVAPAGGREKPDLKPGESRPPETRNRPSRSSANLIRHLESAPIKRVDSDYNIVRYVAEGDPRVAARMPITLRDVDGTRHDPDAEHMTTDELPATDLTAKDVALIKHELKKMILEAATNQDLTDEFRYEIKRTMIQRLSKNTESRIRFAVANESYKWMSFSTTSSRLVTRGQRQEEEQMLISDLVDELFDEQAKESGSENA